jgi:hypothetical protein
MAKKVVHWGKKMVQIRKGPFHKVWPDGGPTTPGPKCHLCETETEKVPKGSLPSHLLEHLSFEDYLWCSKCGQLRAETDPKYIGKVEIKESVRDGKSN